MNEDYIFPEWFIRWASTSSHQVEWNTHNDRSEREKTINIENAVRSYFSQLRSNMPSWHFADFQDRLTKQGLQDQIHNPENYISGRACDHYNLYEQDFDIIQDIWLNGYRFGIERSRIEPSKGKFDDQEIEHYIQYVDELHARWIEPFVTLRHWTLPTRVSDEWWRENSQTIGYFTNYVQHIVNKFHDRVKFWVVLNEPLVFTAMSYLQWYFPPCRKNPISAIRVYFHLIKAHKLSYDIIKNINHDCQVGIAKNQIQIEAHQNKRYNLFFANIANRIRNVDFSQRTAKYNDFLGVNYYFRNIVNIFWAKNWVWTSQTKFSDLGREMRPSHIYHVLKDLKKYNKPIYILENWLADGEDTYRSRFIEQTLKALHQAINEWIDVKWYFHRSLLDNFERDKWFWPRFGLVEIDYQTMQRKVRQSAIWYWQIAKNNWFSAQKS